MKISVKFELYFFEISKFWLFIFNFERYCIRSVAKESGEMTSSLYRSSMCLKPLCYIYHIRPKIEYSCDIWDVAGQFTLACPCFYPRTPFSTLSLFPLSSLLTSYLPRSAQPWPLQLGPPMPCTRWINNFHSLRIALVRCNFHSDSLSPRAVAFRNRLPAGCCLDLINLLMSRVYRYLSDIISYSRMPIQRHTSWVSFGLCIIIIRKSLQPYHFDTSHYRIPTKLYPKI